MTRYNNSEIEAIHFARDFRLQAPTHSDPLNNKSVRKDSFVSDQKPSKKSSPSPPQTLSQDEKTRDYGRQTERRHEKRDAKARGVPWIGKRAPTNIRTFSAGQKAYAMARYQNMTNNDLTRRFNNHFQESPPRTESSINSMVQREKKAKKAKK